MDKNSKKLKLGELFDESFEFKQIIWKIPNVLSLPECVDYSVETPSFTFANATWKIEMYPYGQTCYNSEGYIDLFIVRLNTQITEHHLFYKFYFKTCNGKEFESYSNNALFNFSNVGGVSEYMKRSRFIAMKKVIAPNDVLTVICEMRTKKIAVIYRYPQIEPTTSSSSSDCTLESKVSIPLYDNKVFSDYREFFLKQEDCDVLIKVKGVEFHAHRAILCARSPILASTFRNDMKEKETGTIDIEDCDPSSFSDFLCFLYCGDIQNLSLENVFSLFITADKYDVPDLRTKCLEYMKENLSIDSFCDTIFLALQHSETELIKLSTKFFAKNLQKIIVTVKWQSFVVENPIQSNELMIKALVPDINKPS